MKEINQKKLLEEIITMEATFLVMIKQLNEMKDQLTYLPPSPKKNDFDYRVQRVMIARQKVKMKRAEKYKNYNRLKTSDLPLTNSLTKTAKS